VSIDTLVMKCNICYQFLVHVDLCHKSGECLHDRLQCMDTLTALCSKKDSRANPGAEMDIRRTRIALQEMLKMVRKTS
jgi:hypothetical protein